MGAGAICAGIRPSPSCPMARVLTQALAQIAELRAVQARRRKQKQLERLKKLMANKPRPRPAAKSVKKS
jgi:hypothetical protein